MKQNRKFIPMIALGLTALLSVGNAGEAVWEANTLIFTDNNFSYTNTEKKKLFLQARSPSISLIHPLLQFLISLCW